jgi:hypothetical protein
MATYEDPIHLQELDRRWRMVRGEAFHAGELP